MKKWFGWAGTILRVDLEKRKILKQPLNKELALTFLGGRGFNQKVLWDEIKPGVDPLSPENVLCIGVGPLNGTIFPCSGRYNISYKSPLTGIVGDGSAGGHFAAALKHAGYDQIVFTGKASVPVYLWIDDDHVELKDADYLCGKTTWETEEVIREDEGATGVCSIGPAGENLVRTACVITDWYNAHGMCGPGAVFGSKNLKAIGVRGTIGTNVANPDKFEELTKEIIYKRMRTPEFPYRALHGTTSVPDMQIQNDWDWVKYSTSAVCDLYNNYTSNNMSKHIVRLKGCWACPIHCKRMFQVREGPHTGLKGGGIEYNVLKYNAVVMALNGWEDCCYLNNLYNQLGLSVNHGTTIAYLIYLYKKGLITKEQTDGIELDWGDFELVVELIRRTAKREGYLGNLLAEGAFNIGRILGSEALWHCIHVLGLDSFPDFRGRFTIWLHRCTSTRGSDHLRGDVGGGHISYWAETLNDLKIAENSPHGKHLAAAYSQNYSALMDSYSLCKFLYLLDVFDLEEAAKVMSALTGESFTADKIGKIGERIYNLEQSFNAREGVKRKHMVPPPRWVNEPQPDGLSKGYICRMKDHNEMMDNYLKLRGWDIETATPTRKKLEELGLKYVADELEAHGPYPDWEGPPLWSKKREKQK